MSLLATFILYASFNTLFIYDIKSKIDRSVIKNEQAIIKAISHASWHGIASGNILDTEMSIRYIVESNLNIEGVKVFDQNNDLILAIGNTINGPMIKSVVEPIVRGSSPLTNEKTVAPSDQANYPLGHVQVFVNHPEIIEENIFNFKFLALTIATSIAFFLILFVNLKISKKVTNSIRDVDLFLKKVKNNDASLLEFSSRSKTINKIFVEFITAIESHRQSYALMEQIVKERNEELETTKKILTKENLEKRNLISRLNDTSESERKMISVEIHDQLNASLILINLEAHTIENKIRTIPTSEATDIISTAAKNILYRATALHEQARNIVKSLHPEMLDVLGLQAAIAELVGNFNAAQNECHFVFVAKGNFFDVPTQLALACYRLTQESISNVIKHAKASSCTIELEIKTYPGAEREMIQLSIEDDGRGFLMSTTKGLGLIGMRERVENLGGEIRFNSIEGAGTNILIQLPIDRSEWSRGGGVFFKL
ncbi:MAG: ATP-binding protein [bacterium]|nr:ATP-binding protein [bacterium]